MDAQKILKELLVDQLPEPLYTSPIYDISGCPITPGSILSWSVRKSSDMWTSFGIVINPVTKNHDILVYLKFLRKDGRTGKTLLKNWNRSIIIHPEHINPGYVLDLQLLWCLKQYYTNLAEYIEEEHYHEK